MPFPNAYDLRTGLRQLISYGSVALPRDAGIRFERWFHEELGDVWYWWRGWTCTASA